MIQKKIEILIVDDSLAIHEALKVILKDKYALAFATGGEEALNYLADNPVKLVLLDIKMPHMDGITAFKEIRKRHPKTRVIIVTAHANPKNIRNALSLDAYAIITKPFDPKKLVNIVDKALKT